VKVLAGRTHDLDEDLRFSHPAIAAGLRCGCQPATPVLNSTTRFNPNHVPRPCLKILEMPHAPRSLLSNRTFWFEQQSQNTCVIADIQFSKEGPADDVIKTLESELKIDVVFAEVQLTGGVDGFALAQWVRKNHPDVDVILTSGVTRAAEKAGDLCDEGVGAR
jgi:hypothetical protein